MPLQLNNSSLNGITKRAARNLKFSMNDGLRFFFRELGFVNPSGGSPRTMGRWSARVARLVIKHNRMEVDPMKRPFNDEPVEDLIKKLLALDGTVLDLRLKYIGDAGLEYLAGAEELKGLRELNLERNEITPKGIQALAQSKIITQLTTLHLERNDLGDAGAKIIADSANFSQLKYLNLWKNKIGPEGVRSLANSIILSGLEIMDLAQNQMGDAGAEALAETLTLSGLKYLDVYGNGITEEGQGKLKSCEKLGRIQDLILA